MYIKPKKTLGQHFLKDENIAKKIVGSLSGESYKNILEIGPGMGVLTKYLLAGKKFHTQVVEIDKEAIDYLKDKFPELEDNIRRFPLLRFVKNIPGTHRDHWQFPLQYFKPDFFSCTPV